MLKRGSRIIRDRWPVAIAKLHGPRLIGNVGIPSLLSLSLPLSRIISFESLESLLSTSSTIHQESKTASTKSIGPFTMNNSSKWIFRFLLLYDISVLLISKSKLSIEITFSYINFYFSRLKFCSITMKSSIDPNSFSFCFRSVSGRRFFF